MKFWPKAPGCLPSKDAYRFFLKQFLLTSNLVTLTMTSSPVVLLTMKGFTRRAILLVESGIDIFSTAGFHATVSYTAFKWFAQVSRLISLCQGIRFHGFKIPVLELEQRLMALPYITEAYILPVKDHEAGGLAAALVRLQKTKTKAVNGDNIDLKRIRNDLAATNMASSKFPALLRVLCDDEQVPTTISSKALKKECLRKYFQISGHIPADYAVDAVEYWGNQLDSTTSARVFEWGDIC